MPRLHQRWSAGDRVGSEAPSLLAALTLSASVGPEFVREIELLRLLRANIPPVAASKLALEEGLGGWLARAAAAAAACAAACALEDETDDRFASTLEFEDPAEFAWSCCAKALLSDAIDPRALIDGVL